MEEDFYEHEEYPKYDPAKEAHLEKMKDRLARANYEAVKQYGLDTNSTKNPEIIQEILKETLIYFEELEEYEKCLELKKVLEQF